MRARGGHRRVRDRRPGGSKTRRGGDAGAGRSAGEPQGGAAGEREGRDCRAGGRERRRGGEKTGDRSGRAAPGGGAVPPTAPRHRTVRDGRGPARGGRRRPGASSAALHAAGDGAPWEFRGRDPAARAGPPARARLPQSAPLRCTNARRAPKARRCEEARATPRRTHEADGARGLETAHGLETGAGTYTEAPRGREVLYVFPRARRQARDRPDAHRPRGHEARGVRAARARPAAPALAGRRGGVRVYQKAVEEAQGGVGDGIAGLQARRPGGARGVSALASPRGDALPIGHAPAVARGNEAAGLFSAGEARRQAPSGLAPRFTSTAAARGRGAGRGRGAAAPRGEARGGGGAVEMCRTAARGRSRRVPCRFKTRRGAPGPRRAGPTSGRGPVDEPGPAPVRGPVPGRARDVRKARPGTARGAEARRGRAPPGRFCEEGARGRFEKNRAPAPPHARPARGAEAPRGVTPRGCPATLLFAFTKGGARAAGGLCKTFEASAAAPGRREADKAPRPPLRGRATDGAARAAGARGAHPGGPAPARRAPRRGLPAGGHGARAGGPRGSGAGLRGAARVGGEACRGSRARGRYEAAPGRGGSEDVGDAPPGHAGAASL